MPSERTGPGWDLLTDAVQRQVESRGAPYVERLTMRCSQATRPLVMAAARARGLTTEAYIRRAVSAFVVADLGLDWWELMADEPWTRVYGGTLNEVKPLAGAGYGPWQIDGLSEVP